MSGDDELRRQLRDAEAHALEERRLRVAAEARLFEVQARLFEVRRQRKAAQEHALEVRRQREAAQVCAVQVRRQREAAEERVRTAEALS
ncbi:hypothetical protein E4U14_000794, partial [Claviceps sp. LM454 group G7]